MTRDEERLKRFNCSNTSKRSKPLKQITCQQDLGCGFLRRSSVPIKSRRKCRLDKAPAPRCFILRDLSANESDWDHIQAAGRPGGVSGYPRAWYRSVSCVRALPSTYSNKFVGTFSCAQIDLRKARERELATLD